MSASTGEVSGSVRDKSGQPAEDALVMTLPPSCARVVSGEPPVPHGARTDKDGKYRVGGLPAATTGFAAVSGIVRARGATARMARSSAGTAATPFNVVGKAVRIRSISPPLTLRPWLRPSPADGLAGVRRGTLPRLAGARFPVQPHLNYHRSRRASVHSEDFLRPFQSTFQERSVTAAGSRSWARSSGFWSGSSSDPSIKSHRRRRPSTSESRLQHSPLPRHGSPDRTAHRRGPARHRC